MSKQFEPVAVQPASLTAEVEQVARDAARLSFEAARLAVGRDAPLRRALRDLVGLGGLGLALVAAFALANTAAVEALAGLLPGWRAPLVLAGVWAAVGAVVAATVLRGRVGLLARRRRTRQGGVVADRSSIEQAEQALRDTIERLSPAVALAAEQRVAAAVMPIVGQMAQTGEEVIRSVLSSS